MKMRSWYQTAVMTVAASALCGSLQAQDVPGYKVVYDTSTTNAPSQVQYLTSENEFGDQIKLAGSGPLDRTIGQFKLEYYLSRYVSGNESIQVRLYDNTGANGEPGALLWDSGEFDLRNTGYNTLVINNPTDADGNALTVPDWITWTVSFGGIEGNETAGLILYDSPSVGEDYTDYWVKNEDGWHTQVLPDSPVTFGAQVVAVPEPGTMSLALLGALGMLSTIALRRRSSK